MAGRAGRAGLDTVGESVIFAKDSRRLEAIRALMGAAPREISSCLFTGAESPEALNQLKRVVLEAVTSGLVRSKEDMKRYVSSTLMATLQSKTFDVVEAITKQALQELQKEHFIMWTKDGVRAACGLATPPHSPAAAPRFRCAG